MTTAEIIKIATRNCSGVTSAKEWVFTEEEILWFVNELSTAERLHVTTAALTSPASGWVKVESEKDLPERRTDIVTEWIDVNHSNPVWLIRRCDHTFIKWLFQQGRTIRYLSETPLPSVGECMEYAKEAPDATDYYQSDFNAATDRILRDKGASNKDVYDANIEVFEALKKNYKITRICQ